jgi:HemK-related putative methylase
MMPSTNVVPIESAVRVNPLFRWLSLAWLIVRRPFLLRRVDRYVIEDVAGVPIAVLPSVWNPVVFRTGEYLARSLLEGSVGQPSDHEHSQRALDMGTGSGIGAIFAARRGYQVIAVDLNPEAVRCARVNALMNRLEGLIEVRQGDLFEPVAREQFDLVLFNPPFFRGTPKDLADMAWRGVDVLERFAAGLPGALRPGGHALIVLSTDGEGAALLKALEENGMRVDAVDCRNLGNEVMTVYCAKVR